MRKTLLTLVIALLTLAFTLPAAAHYVDPYGYDNYGYGNYGYNNYYVDPYIYSNGFGSDYYNNVYYANDYSKSSSTELRYVYDLDGNVIGEYRKYGTGYRAYFGTDDLTPNYVTTTSTSSTSTKKTYTVRMEDDEFTPYTLTIKKGSTVKWTNYDHANHTVTGDKSSYNISSSTLSYGKTYSKTFNTTGTYYYHDKYHSSMKGKIVVKS